MLRFLATGDVTMSWLAVETSDVPFVLKLASGDLTNWAAGDTVSWDRAIYTAATFPATVWSHPESLVQTGLKTERDNKRDKTRAGAKTGRGGGSGVVSQGVSCHSLLDVQKLPTPTLRWFKNSKLQIIFFLKSSAFTYIKVSSLMKNKIKPDNIS